MTAPRNQHKKQHHIPQSYLDAWCDPSDPGRVWLFARDSRAGTREKPRDLFWEHDFYTETSPSGDRDLTIEHALGKLESQFVELRRSKLEKREPPDPREHRRLCWFCAAMSLRTKANRDHVRAQWQPMREYGEELEQQMRAASPEERERLQQFLSPMPSAERGQSFNLDDMRHIERSPVQVSLRSSLAHEAKLYQGMDAAILCSDDPVGFITSDNPCVWRDQNGLHPFGAYSLASQTVEVFLPLAPGLLLLLNRRGFRGYCSPVPEVLADVNRAIRESCYRSFVVRRNHTSDAWFAT